MASRTRSKATSESKFSRGTIVSVRAGSFDAEGENECWSSHFKNGAQQELYGVVDKVYATRVDVYFFFDRVTTKVNLELLPSVTYNAIIPLRATFREGTKLDLEVGPNYPCRARDKF